MLVFYILVLFLTVLGIVTLFSFIINKFLKHKSSNKHLLLIKFSELPDKDMELKLLLAKLNWLNLSDFNDIIIYNKETSKELENVCKLYHLKYINNLSDIENIL